MNQAQARDEAIEAVAASHPQWMVLATIALQHVASRRPLLTSEDVWAELAERNVPDPDETRAMGAIMRKGVAEGWIGVLPDFRVVDGVRRNHGRPMRLYRSLLLGKPVPAWPGERAEPIQEVLW